MYVCAHELSALLDDNFAFASLKWRAVWRAVRVNEMLVIVFLLVI